MADDGEPPLSGDEEEEEEEEEEEDFEDGDFPFVKPGDEGYERVQKAFEIQLRGVNERVTAQLQEKSEELKKLQTHREEIGQTLYGAQQQLAKLQLEHEKLHDKFANVRQKRGEDEEALKQVTVSWNGKKGELDEAQKRLAKSQDELNQLNVTLRQVEEYNEQMKAEIHVTRRATHKAEDQIKKVEGIKHKQDILIDTMNEEVKRLTDQKAMLDAQIVAQRQETEAATATLREASKEIEAIEFEKKQLMQQWRSSLVSMQRRDEALQNVQKALREEDEAELAIENEIRGLNNSVRAEQARHEDLSALKDRNNKEMQHLDSQASTIKQDREKLLEQFNMLKGTMDKHVEETTQLKSQVADHNHHIQVHERNIQSVSREITCLVGKIDEETSEQTTCDRVHANSKKRMIKIREETTQKEVDTQSLHNEIARVTVDSLNTKGHNQMLKDRHKALTEDLTEREKLIEQYEQEIRKRHHQIEKKQLYVDQLNKKFDDKRKQLESEAGEGDVAGPQEAKLKHMRKQITDLTKDCQDMQKDWLQKQTQLLQHSTDTDKLKTNLNDQKNRKMVLEQKKIRVDGALEAQKKEIKELESSMKHLRFDMDRMNVAMVKNEAKSTDLGSQNSMMEMGFVQKLKEIEGKCLDTERSIESVREDKIDMSSEVMEAERQVLLWERKITLEKEMQAALDPNQGQADAQAMQKEIHRMELRLDQLKRRQEQMIKEMEQAIHKRDAISLKYEPKAKKNKQASTSANVKRQVQSLRNNLRLCTQASSDAEQKIAEREGELTQLQQAIEQSSDDYSRLEQDARQLRSDVQVGAVEKQRNLAGILKLQRTAKRLDELAMGTGPPPPANIRAQHGEQVVMKNRVTEIIRVLHDAYPQLVILWEEFYVWLDGDQQQQPQ